MSKTRFPFGAAPSAPNLLKLKLYKGFSWAAIVPAAGKSAKALTKIASPRRFIFNSISARRTRPSHSHLCPAEIRTRRMNPSHCDPTRFSCKFAQMRRSTAPFRLKGSHTWRSLKSHRRSGDLLPMLNCDRNTGLRPGGAIRIDFFESGTSGKRTPEPAGILSGPLSDCQSVFIDLSWRPPGNVLALRRGKQSQFASRPPPAVFQRMPKQARTSPSYLRVSLLRPTANPIGGLRLVTHPLDQIPCRVRPRLCRLVLSLRPIRRASPGGRSRNPHHLSRRPLSTSLGRQER